jgi:ADP-ribose pyrophosphatase YjhB (NUDIX family)
MANFCIQCGSLLLTKEIENRDRQVCPQCGWIYYEHRKLSAAVLAEREGKLLLVKRGIEPWYGKWCTPAGYMEVDEQPKDAASREASEETGLKFKVGELVGVYTYHDDPRGNGLVLIYHAEVIGGILAKTAESIDAGFFSPSEIKTMELAGASTDLQVMDWMKTKGLAGL